MPEIRPDLQRRQQKKIAPVYYRHVPKPAISPEGQIGGQLSPFLRARSARNDVSEGPKKINNWLYPQDQATRQDQMQPLPIVFVAVTINQRLPRVLSDQLYGRGPWKGHRAPQVRRQNNNFADPQEEI